MITDTDWIYLQKFKKSLAVKYNKKSEAQFFQDPTCSREYKLEIKKVQSRIPVKYRRHTLTSLNHPHVKLSKEYVQEYIDNLDKNKELGVGPFLVGDAGLGKTLCGCVVLTKALEKNYSAYYVKVGECVDLLTSSWYDQEVRQEFNEKVLGSDFLLLDDLGDELESMASNLVESTISRILRHRTDSLKPTIITTNLDDKKIQTKYGPRIFSILKEHSIVISFKGTDYREKVIAPKLNLD